MWSRDLTLLVRTIDHMYCELRRLSGKLKKDGSIQHVKPYTTHQRHSIVRTTSAQVQLVNGIGLRYHRHTHSLRDGVQSSDIFLRRDIIHSCKVCMVQSTMRLLLRPTRWRERTQFPRLDIGTRGQQMGSHLRSVQRKRKTTTL